MKENYPITMFNNQTNNNFNKNRLLLHGNKSLYKFLMNSRLRANTSDPVASLVIAVNDHHLSSTHFLRHEL